VSIVDSCLIASLLDETQQLKAADGCMQAHLCGIVCGWRLEPQLLPLPVQVLWLSPAASRSLQAITGR
jgi:hypothetical protein